MIKTGHNRRIEGEKVVEESTIKRAKIIGEGT